MHGRQKTSNISRFSIHFAATYFVFKPPHGKAIFFSVDVDIVDIDVDVDVDVNCDIYSFRYGSSLEN